MHDFARPKEPLEDIAALISRICSREGIVRPHAPNEPIRNQSRRLNVALAGGGAFHGRNIKPRLDGANTHLNILKRNCFTEQRKSPGLPPQGNPDCAVLDRELTQRSTISVKIAPRFAHVNVITRFQSLRYLAAMFDTSSATFWRQEAGEITSASVPNAKTRGIISNS